MNTSKLVKILSAVTICTLVTQCGEQPSPTASSTAPESPAGGQANVKDDQSQKDIVKVAIGSPDHTTLVAAVQAADYVNVLANAGPFTVFAPTNAAFAKLPAGTGETLIKPENKDKLRDILEYHVAVGSYRADILRDGQNLGMATSGNVKVSLKDGKIMINDVATVIASVPASNGIIHIVDTVILQPAN